MDNFTKIKKSLFFTGKNGNNFVTVIYDDADTMQREYMWIGGCNNV